MELKPEESHLIEAYGKKDIFEKRLKEGYTEVSFGTGPWVKNQRIVNLFVFYHPNGNIATYEQPKFSNEGQTVRGTPHEEKYSQKEFNKLKERWNLKVKENRHSLKEILDEWPKS
jgi:hypothetical protein